MPEFVEKNLPGSRKKIFNEIEKTGLYPTKPGLKVKQSESLRELDVDELSENQ